MVILIVVVVHWHIVVQYPLFVAPNDKLIQHRLITIFVFHIHIMMVLEGARQIRKNALHNIELIKAVQKRIKHVNNEQNMINYVVKYILMITKSSSEELAR